MSDAAVTSALNVQRTGAPQSEVPSSVRASTKAGFTLLEMLVAFTILATSTIVVQRAVGVVLDSISRAKARVEAENVAQALLTGPIAFGAMPASSGSTDGTNWTMRFSPVAMPGAKAPQNPGQAAPWKVVRMTVHVSDRRWTSSGFDLDTIRLVRTAQP